MSLNPSTENIADMTGVIPPPEPPSVIIDWKDKQLNSYCLTTKEHEIAELLLKGLATKEIAQMLGNTDKTVKHHIAAIFKKSHVNTRAEFFATIFCL